MIEKLFGQRVKDIRNSMNISQEEIGTIIGMERSQLSKIEGGNANITLETVERIAKALNVKITSLFDESNLKKSKETDGYSEDKINPFVKWAGGKKQLLKQLKDLLPVDFNNYYEPFVGGGALFFNLAPKKASINDSNYELIQAYQCIKDKKLFIQLIEALETHEKNHNEAYYLEVRAMDRNDNLSTLDKVTRAARMIYLNKACFNGLYRVNSNGYFNVPSAKKEVVKTFNRESLLNVHNYLSTNDIKITSLDFNESVKSATKGDFIYFDPPYDTYENQNNFTSYGKDIFGKDEQVRLFETFDKLAKKGVYVMLSNHNTEFIRNLYKEYNFHHVQAKRMINSNASKRGSVEEIIITNY